MSLKGTAETDHESVSHVRGRTTKDLPVSVEVVADAQYGIPGADQLAGRDCRRVGRIRERPLVLTDLMLVSIYLIGHRLLVRRFVVNCRMTVELRFTATCR